MEILVLVFHMLVVYSLVLEVVVVVILVWVWFLVVIVQHSGWWRWICCMDGWW